MCSCLVLCVDTTTRRTLANAPEVFVIWENIGPNTVQYTFLMKHVSCNVYWRFRGVRSPLGCLCVFFFFEIISKSSKILYTLWFPYVSSWKCIQVYMELPSDHMFDQELYWKCIEGGSDIRKKNKTEPTWVWGREPTCLSSRLAAIGRHRKCNWPFSKYI